MRFLLRDLTKSFARIPPYRIKIGFAIPQRFPYSRVMASTRIRVYDVITMFENEPGYFAELYKPWRKYDIVIFQKFFDEEAYGLAVNLKDKGARIVLDVNVNYYDRYSRLIKDMQRSNIMRFTEIADAVITPSSYIKGYIKKIFPDKYVETTYEYIPDFKAKKEMNMSVNCLVWMGYSGKAKEVLLIKNVMKRLRETYDYQLILICDRDPKISVDGLNVRFMKYRKNDYFIRLLKGDIFISPRDLNETYNLGHSFTRIGIPMCAGIPVIASAVPSYIGSPAILIDSLDEEEWYKNLRRLFDSFSLRQDLSQMGIAYVKNNYSYDAVRAQYIDLFRKLSSD